MPTTAMGIWANCAWPNTLSMAPYTRSMLLMAAMAATREIWDRKLVAPSDKVRRHTGPSRASSFRPICSIFMWSKYQTASRAVMIWPMTVATAAPIIPQRNTKMNTGSRMILATAPAKVDTMANRGLPSARMTGFIAWPNM